MRAIAQNGLTYAEDPFDRERYEEVHRIAAEIAASNSAVDPDLVVGNLFAMEEGYATPKIDIRGVVLRRDADGGGAVLLVREKEDGSWTLPGGWVDVGESPSEAVVREVEEESGYLTRAVRLLALWDRDKHPHPPIPHHVYKLFFLCELRGGEAVGNSLETEGAGFFGVEELPPLSLTRVTPGQIRELLKLAQDDRLPTEFD